MKYVKWVSSEARATYIQMYSNTSGSHLKGPEGHRDTMGLSVTLFEDRVADIRSESFIGNGISNRYDRMEDATKEEFEDAYCKAIKIIQENHDK